MNVFLAVTSEALHRSRKYGLLLAYIMHPSTDKKAWQDKWTEKFNNGIKDRSEGDRRDDGERTAK